jgi:hypothetical protein
LKSINQNKYGTTDGTVPHKTSLLWISKIVNISQQFSARKTELKNITSKIREPSKNFSGLTTDPQIKEKLVNLPQVGSPQPLGWPRQWQDPGMGPNGGNSA